MTIQRALIIYMKGSRMISKIKNGMILLMKKVWRKMKSWRGDEAVEPPLFDPNDRVAYGLWLSEQNEDVVNEKIKKKPLISILVPVYDVKSKFLRKCLDSILRQKYDNFEICVVDNASSSDMTKKIIKKYGKNEKIKTEFRRDKGDVSRVLNDALGMAEGEYVALVDAGDELAQNALLEVVKILNENSDADLVYTDEDKIDLKGKRFCPHFKPDWSPDTLLGLNYIHRLAVVRTELVKKVGEFRKEAEGAEEYDLLLRVTEKAKKIYHVPKVLYHFRENDKSLPDKSSSNADKKAIRVAIERRGTLAKVKKDSRSGYHYVLYDIEKEPLVSIIIPTKDYAEVTETCLESVYQKTTYKNYEVIVVNNRSEEDATFELFDKYKKKYKNFRVIDANMEFNYSKINNLAVEQAKGEVVILLNNDTEVITPDWMTWMVGYAVQPHVGAVGAELLYPDDRIQHAGVILGLGQSRVAGHAYVDKDKDELGSNGRLSVPYDYSAVTAACLCIEKKKFKKVGGLEEKLKIAFNDVDFNVKLLEKGYYNVFLPMVKLYHYESRSRGLDVSPEKQKRFEKEMSLMKKKWKNILLEDKYYNKNLSLDCSFVLKRKEEK